jgi:MFS family permease
MTAASTPARGPLPLRRNRDYMVLWSGQVVSVLGSEITLLAFPLLVLALTGSAAQAGIVAFFNTAPVLLLNLPGGVFTDRHDRRKTMIACNLLGALAIGSLAVALAINEMRFGHVVLAAFLQGAATVVFSLAEQGALPQVVAREQVADAVAQNESRDAGWATARRRAPRRPATRPVRGGRDLLPDRRDEPGADPDAASSATPR